MKRKTLSAIALFLSFSIYFSCVDDGVYVPKESYKVPETDLLAYAKQLVGENGEGCSLIDFQKGNPHSRSVTDYSTVATPLWEKAKTEYFDDEEVLTVPLQSEDDIYSSMFFEEEHKERLYQTKTFSRLVVRNKNGQTTPQVLTYLPGRNYAKNRQAVLDTMGFSPLSVKYYGTILVSSLEGEFLQGFFYERGVPIMKIKKNTHIHNDTTECDHTEHSQSMHVLLKLTGNMVVASRSYDVGDEAEYIKCRNCSKNLADCKCENPEIEYIVCDSCKKIKIHCECPPKCVFCNHNPCICAVRCVACKQYPCICTPKRCEHCLKYYCNGECQNPKPEEPEEEPGEEPGGDSENEIAPRAKELFYNPNMQQQDWLKLENMLVEILDDCMGGELFNALRETTIPIQISDIPLPFSSFDPLTGINLSREAQSFHLLLEMMNAYRARTLSVNLYNSTRLNGEIEAFYAQYLYISRQSDFESVKWDKFYHSGMAFEAVKKLEDVLNDKGELRSGKNNADLIEAVNAVATYLQRTIRCNNYTFDASRTGLDNFNNLKTLTTRCQ